jgi:hypothetical protein
MLDFDDITTYKLLIRACNEKGASPSSSIEMEDFFRNLLKTYGGEVELTDWLRRKVAENFRTLGVIPKWLQNSEWPIKNNRPMIFVGQIDVLGSLAPDLFHDDTSFYLFILPEEEPVVIEQQM